MEKADLQSFENTYFLIPARKGSKGFAFKNRFLFDSTANIIPENLRDKVYVSSDDEELEKKASFFGFNFVQRPKKYAQDKTSMKDVLIHFCNEKKLKKDDIIILLFLTYPDRTWESINKIHTYFLEQKAKSLICLEPVSEHPYLMFVKEGEENYKLLIEHSLYRRQDYPTVHKQSFYCACYLAEEVHTLRDLLFSEGTTFYTLDNINRDIDYERQLR